MKPHYSDDSVTLYHGDCLEVLAELPDASVDSVVTDPPYGLEFMGKGWDAPWEQAGVNADAGFHGGGLSATRNAPSFTGSTNPKCLTCKGTRRGRRDGTAKVAVCLCADGGRFPNHRAVEMRAFQEWCEQWAAECLRVLKPGGHMLAFGGSRTWHRLAAAVEDAGFEIRDSIAWLYGSGFPKSLDVSKAIDKRPGVLRHAEFGAMLREAMTAKGYTNTFDVAEKVIGRRTGAVANWVKYQFPEAKWWPALRDLLDLDDDTWGPVIAEAERQKIGTKAGNRLAFAPGQGGDRSAIDLDMTTPATGAAQQWAGWGTALKPAFEPIVVARKPLAGTVAENVLAHGTGALNIDATRVDLKGETWGGNEASAHENYSGKVFGTFAKQYAKPSNPAGRWPTNVVLDDTQAAELDRQSGTTVSRVGKPRGAANGEGWGMTATGAEYDDEGGASRFFPTFRYEAKAPTSERPRYTRPMLRIRGDLTPAQVDHVRARLAEAGVQVD